MSVWTEPVDTREDRLAGGGTTWNYDVDSPGRHSQGALCPGCQAIRVSDTECASCGYGHPESRMEISSMDIIWATFAGQDNWGSRRRGRLADEAARNPLI